MDNFGVFFTVVLNLRYSHRAFIRWLRKESGQYCVDMGGIWLYATSQEGGLMGVLGLWLLLAEKLEGCIIQAGLSTHPATVGD